MPRSRATAGTAAGAQAWPAGPLGRRRHGRRAGEHLLGGSPPGSTDVGGVRTIMAETVEVRGCRGGPRWFPPSANHRSCPESPPLSIACGMLCRRGAEGELDTRPWRALSDDMACSDGGWRGYRGILWPRRHMWLQGVLEAVDVASVPRGAPRRRGMGQLPTVSLPAFMLCMGPSPYHVAHEVFRSAAVRPTAWQSRNAAGVAVELARGAAAPSVRCPRMALQLASTRGEGGEQVHRFFFHFCLVLEVQMHGPGEETVLSTAAGRWWEARGVCCLNRSPSRTAHIACTQAPVTVTFPWPKPVSLNTA